MVRPPKLMLVKVCWRTLGSLKLSPTVFSLRTVGILMKLTHPSTFISVCLQQHKRNYANEWASQTKRISNKLDHPKVHKNALRQSFPYMYFNSPVPLTLCSTIVSHCLAQQIRQDWLEERTMFLAAEKPHLSSGSMEKSKKSVSLFREAMGSAV